MIFLFSFKVRKMGYFGYYISLSLINTGISSSPMIFFKVLV